MNVEIGNEAALFHFRYSAFAVYICRDMLKVMSVAELFCSFSDFLSGKHFFGPQLLK